MISYRHILSSLSAAALIFLLSATSCTRIAPGHNGTVPISFDLLPLSKTIVESAADMTEFAVWGQHTSTDASTVSTIFNATCIYNDFGWTYDSPRYWTEGSYSFYALHPYKQAINTTCTTDGLTIDFKSPEADIDLMIADADRTYTPTDPTTAAAVPLTFEHLLARVIIEVRTEADNLSVSSLSLSGEIIDAYYDATSAQWDLGQTTGNHEADISEGGIIISSTAATVLDLLMIPQTPDDVQISVSYSTGENDPETHGVSLPSTTSWEKGRQYRYTLTLGTTDANISVEVVNWAVEDYTVEW